MKKFLFIIAAMLCLVATTQTAQAQKKGDMAAGVHLDAGFAYGGGYSNFGIGAKFQYSVIDNLRLEPSFTYYFRNDYVSMWNLMANVHYVFPLLDEKLNVYPLVGLGVLGSHVSYDDWWYGGKYSASTAYFAADFGAGAEYKITSALAVGLELKYEVTSNLGHLGLQVGVTYSF